MANMVEINAKLCLVINLDMYVRRINIKKEKKKKEGIDMFADTLIIHYDIWPHIFCIPVKYII